MTSTNHDGSQFPKFCFRWNMEEKLIKKTQLKKLQTCQLFVTFPHKWYVMKYLLNLYGKK